jgi:ribosomal protein S18 acetylase RimI-like enzyme
VDGRRATGGGASKNQARPIAAVVCDHDVVVEVSTPAVDELGDVLDTLGEWQRDDGPMQLHPGDVGWFWRFGAVATAAAVRVWRQDGRTVAVGLLDSPTLLRAAIRPAAAQDEELARSVVTDLTDPERGVLTQQAGGVEAPARSLVRELLAERGWTDDEPWSPLRRDLARPVPDSDVRIEVIGAARAHVRTALQRASFERSSFTDDRWRTMAAGPAYARARCLVAYRATGEPVAAVTVWSAGPDRPGLIEPMGVHRDHRGQGFGTAITVAGAAALQRLGSSSAIVCTPSANTGGVATYAAAGFRRLHEIQDLRRGA